MKLDRREFLLIGGVTAAATRLALGAPDAQAAPSADHAGEARWIWFPGQLAAHRHARRVHRAMQRCTMVGYPGNFRQPLSETYFRISGTATRDVPLRWSGPLGRIRVLAGSAGGDVTNRSRVLRAGQTGIEVHVDFAGGLPCFLLDGAEFSTGPAWEASLDGEHWTPVEASEDGDPQRLPDAEREAVVSIPVLRIVDPDGPPHDAYPVAPGHDLLLDFGETELGAVRFDVRGAGELTIQVGESIAEVRDTTPTLFEQYPLAAVRATAEVASVALPERAVRFVRVAASERAELSHVRFEARVSSAEERGRFESSDSDLNAIWRTAVATLRSNMHDFYLDGIRRDGLVWHDGPLSLDAYERVFFDADLSRQTLIAETLPARPRVGDLGIIDGPMYTVVGFARELLVRGDPSFSKLFRDRIEEVLAFYASLQDGHGFVDARRVEPYGYFPDWSATDATGPDPHGSPAYGQMLLAGMFAAGARLAQAWQDETGAERWRQAASRVAASIRSTFWQPQDGLYANGFDRTGRLDTRRTTFAQAFAVAFDVAEPGERPGLFRFLDDERTRPAHFSLSQVVELTAYAKAGRAAEALARLRSVWLPMIQQGYRRFFEDIHPTLEPLAQLAMYGRKYGNSLCHAWAGAAPVMALSRGVLGVEPIEPGYRVCTIAPQRCGLEWVRGAVPTPTGIIEIEWHGERGAVTLPPGISARLSDDRVIEGPDRFPVVVS
jgi:alpha-L-rhamnosidase